MHILRLLTCIALLGWGAVVVKIQAQIPAAGPCYAIEAYPDAPKRPIFTQFLKDARSLTDKSAQLIVDGRIADLYSANRPGFVGDIRFASPEAFLKEFADMEQREGKVLKFEYRGQGLAFSKHRSDVPMYSTTIYAIETTSQKEGAYLDIRTMPSEKGPLVFFVWLEHFPPGSPDRLTFGKGEGRVCEEG